MTWGCDIVRKRNGEERGRQSLERSLEPLEPLEPFEPLEPIEPLLEARQKPFCLACGSPLNPILWRTALQAEVSHWILIRGRCPRLLIVVPSRHRSA